jgi:hypothetical protein
MSTDVDKSIVEAIEETVMSRGQNNDLATKILTWVGEIHSSNENLEDKNSVANRIESLLSSTKE